MPEPRRIDRIRALIQRELSELIQQELKDPRVKFCSVSQVEVSSDLRYADVKLSVVGNKRQKALTLAGIQHASSFLRREVAQRIGLRHAMELRFELDEGVDHLMQIDRLLKQVQAENDASETVPPSEGL